jgi:hypothetical protein
LAQGRETVDGAVPVRAFRHLFRVFHQWSDPKHRWLNDWRELLPAKPDAAPSKGSFAKAAIIVLAKLLVCQLFAHYAIKAERRRQKGLVQMVRAAVHQCGQRLALRAAAQLHKQAWPAAKTLLDDHTAECPGGWRN